MRSVDSMKNVDVAYLTTLCNAVFDGPKEISNDIWMNPNMNLNPDLVKALNYMNVPIAIDNIDLFVYNIIYRSKCFKPPFCVIVYFAFVMSYLFFFVSTILTAKFCKRAFVS